MTEKAIMVEEARVTARIPLKLKQEAAAKAKEIDMSLSQIIRKALRELVQDDDDPEED